MKVLITGGAGFIGSNLVRKYLEKGDEVYIVDNLSTGKYENIADLAEEYSEKIVFTKDTIMNDAVLSKATEKADIVIHLAAAVGVKFIIENPLSSMETNIIGTENVLKWALRFKKKIFIASSSEVYGDQEKVPLEEKDSVVYGPTFNLRWSYAASKLVDELLALAYFRTFNLSVIICRFFNIIGPNQTGEYGMVVPRFIESALKHEPLQVYGDGKQTRTFTYIDDAVQAVVDMVDSEKCIGEIANVGGDEEIEIFELAKKIIDLTDSRSNIEFVPYEKVYSRDFDDMRRRVPSLKKIKSLIDYKPKFNLEASLVNIITEMKKKYNRI